jgi:hypothetical protein
MHRKPTKRELVVVSQPISPIELVTIAGSQNQTFSAIGVPRIRPSFQIPLVRSWEQELDSILTMILSTNPIPSSVFSQISQLSWLAFSSSSDQMIKFISQRIESQVKLLCSRVTNDDLETLFDKIQIFAHIFSPFQVSFTDIFYQKIYEHLPPFLSEVAQYIVKLLGATETRPRALKVLTLLDSAKIFSIPEILSEIADAIMKHIQQPANRQNSQDKLQIYQSVYLTFETIFPYLPKLLQRTISEELTTTMIKSDIEAFVGAVSPIVYDQSHDLCPLLFTASDTTTLVREFASFVEDRLSEAFDVETVFRLHQGIVKWPSYQRGLLEVILKKFVSPNAKLFLTALLRDLKNPNLVESLALFEDSNLVESVYGSLLLKHCVENDVESDRRFIEKYQTIGSKEKVYGLRAILKDYDEGFNVALQFPKPQFLMFSVLSIRSWKCYRENVTFPNQIDEQLSAFSAFYFKKFAGRKLHWDATLSSVILQYLNTSIHCDGLIASFLIFLDSKVLSMKRIASKLGVKLQTVESLYRGLRSQKSKAILSVKGDEVSLNLSNSSESEIVLSSMVPRTEPFVFPKEPMPTFMPESAQLDSLILRFLKDATVIAESDLFSKLEGVVKFSITKEFFQSRLQTLEKRRFLAKEPNEMWKYIP